MHATIPKLKLLWVVLKFETMVREAMDVFASPKGKQKKVGSTTTLPVTVY